MLELDAAKRLTHRQVLQHQFTSMHHMANRYHVSPWEVDVELLNLYWCMQKRHLGPIVKRKHNVSIHELSY